MKMPFRKSNDDSAGMSEAEVLWYSGTWVDRVPQSVSITALGLAFLAVWWAIAEMELVSRILLPGPSETWEELVSVSKNIFTGGHILESLTITTQEVILGFIAAAISGFALGVLVGETRLGRKAVMPYLIGLNALPKVAFAPVFVAWFGFGINSKIVMALFIAFFPVIVDTAAGLAAVDPDTQMLFRSMRASRWQTLRKLKLPSAMPFVFAGLKTAAVFSVVGAVVGEYLGGGHGLGELIRLSAQTLRIDRVFALILYLGILGMALFGVVAWAQRRVVFWQESDLIEVQIGG